LARFHHRFARRIARSHNGDFKLSKWQQTHPRKKANRGKHPVRSYIKTIEIDETSSKLFVGEMDEVSDLLKDQAQVWYYLMPHKALLLSLLNRSNTIHNEFANAAFDFQSFWINHIGRRGYKPFPN
jgi:hypothetical protein